MTVVIFSLLKIILVIFTCEGIMCGKLSEMNSENISFA